ncbi:hypothetical protein RHMOL_Rhmol04G0328100 [Rhododendron molle]|uniref:Uncharacterized protein n=1 Tax=Rhododendron molle TaxID=49168 RepID=A0ACC0P7A7_RHOML|nr:hypothetical protein RHMOL_Rhmol04G0328100 [Rhododendron molle]
MDPLSVLRDYAIRNDLDSIVRVNDDFRFGSDYSFPAATPTAYRSKQGHLFTLETLIHFLKHSHLKFTDYIENIRPLAIPHVSFLDRKPLLDYLLCPVSPVSPSDAVQFASPNFSTSAAAVATKDESSETASRPFDPSHGVEDLMEWSTNDNVTTSSSSKEQQVDSINSKFDEIALTPFDEMITLRPFDLSDVEDLMEWTTDDNVTRFCVFDTYTSKEQAVNFIKNVAIPHPWLRAICLKNRAIGSISVAPGSGIGAGRGEIGYALASKHWGKGIVTRAVEMAVSSVFSEWPHLVRLEALVDVENLGSQRVMEKAGFHREGVLRKYAFIKGRYRDLVMFSLVRFDVP